MAANVPVVNGHVVASLYSAVIDGAGGISDVPGLLKRVIAENMWQERYVEQIHEVVRFERFIDFLIARPPEGLRTDLKTMQRLCMDDPEAIEALDKATQGKRGGDRKSNRINVDNIHIDNPIRPAGTSPSAALRRLRKDRPDLHERVLTKELSPHAAMVAAGFRVKNISVPLDPERAPALLAKHFPIDVLVEAIRLKNC